MLYIVDNAVPILAAALAAVLFGAAWYGWLDRRSAPHGGAAREGRAFSSATLVLALLAEAWMAAILAGALILAPVEAGRWTVALGSAGIIWAGFVLPVVAVTHGLRRLGWRRFAIDAVHWLGAMLLMAAVLRAIGVAAPAAAATLPAPSAAPGGGVTSLAGEWRVAGVDGAPFDEPYGLALSADDKEIWWEPRCAGLVRRYTLAGERLAVSMPPAQASRAAAAPPSVPVCALAPPPALAGVRRALDAAQTARRTPENGLLLSGGGHSLLLFAQ
ncbi:DUF1761 domain-containing protein [Qipengyuania thermophila]|uniref:DUF1761 domain-containing protein n=1 Tax=Qipengyuania thermophila TaxID=2509361 RepID=UPI0018F86F44|nr:DUF1761 domain-containing protein [Qipengyuania thermophila]